jgi:hypothetical protein
MFAEYSGCNHTLARTFGTEVTVVKMWDKRKQNQSRREVNDFPRRTIYCPNRLIKLREQHEGLWRNCANSVTHALEHVSDPSQEDDSFQHRKWAILSVAHAAVPENIIKTTIRFWITSPLYSSLLLNTKPECT